LPSTKNLQQLSIDCIRTLSMDAVQKANSGHPGTPMALAPLAYVLWNEFLRYDPTQPLWPGRDRFVLSAGHASMLLYALSHLAEVRQCDRQGNATGELAVPLEHMQRFRQLHSRCPGHPEFGETTGVETTTGPLGQGAGNSVGMAIAQRFLSARYDRDGSALFDYRVFAVCGDGDLMEGVTAEAASLAGHLGLSNLCWFYDSNQITIEGHTDLAFTEDVLARFRGYGWRTEQVDDVNDLDRLRAAIQAFQSHGEAKPTLILVKSHIAYGAPTKQDTHGAHGAP
jgi:transketolase